ncbi:hypothetical protein PCE1_004106 [Barthelona sp. PCE]
MSDSEYDSHDDVDVLISEEMQPVHEEEIVTDEIPREVISGQISDLQALLNTSLLGFNQLNVLNNLPDRKTTKLLNKHKNTHENLRSNLEITMETLNSAVELNMKALGMDTENLSIKKISEAEAALEHVNDTVLEMAFNCIEEFDPRSKTTEVFDNSLVGRISHDMKKQKGMALEKLYIHHTRELMQLSESTSSDYVRLRSLQKQFSKKKVHKKSKDKVLSFEVMKPLAFFMVANPKPLPEYVDGLYSSLFQ